MLKIFYSLWKLQNNKRVWKWDQAKQDVKKAKLFTRSCNSGLGGVLCAMFIWVFWAAGRMNAGKDGTEMESCKPLPPNHHISLGWRRCWDQKVAPRSSNNSRPQQPSHAELLISLQPEVTERCPDGEDRIRWGKVHLTNIRWCPKHEHLQCSDTAPQGDTDGASWRRRSVIKCHYQENA